MTKPTHTDPEASETGVRELQDETWRLLREPCDPKRDESVISLFLQIIEVAEREMVRRGVTTASYVDRDLFFPILARRRDPTAARAIVDRIIALRAGLTPQWIEKDWAKACQDAAEEEAPPTAELQQTRALQRLIERGRALLATWGVPSDALPQVHRALHPNAPRGKICAVLEDIFRFILDEGEKATPRITDPGAAEAAVNDITAALTSAGMVMDGRRRWHAP